MWPQSSTEGHPTRNTYTPTDWQQMEPHVENFCTSQSTPGKQTSVETCQSSSSLQPVGTVHLHYCLFLQSLFGWVSGQLGIPRKTTDVIYCTIIYNPKNVMPLALDVLISASGTECGVRGHHNLKWKKAGDTPFIALHSISLTARLPLQASWFLTRKYLALLYLRPQHNR